MSDAESIPDVVVGCGTVGLPLLSSLVNDSQNALGLEASERLGGSSFLVSRLQTKGKFSEIDFVQVRELPPLRIWWERSWLSHSEVDWENSDWAFALPQWNFYFGDLVEVMPKDSVLETTKSCVKTQKPVSEVSFDNGKWKLRSGTKVFTCEKLHWTLGLKAFQTCIGKKEAEEFLVKNENFQEKARDADGVLAAEYDVTRAIPFEIDKFVGLPVRHNSKLYLAFVSLHERRLESFTYLPQDILAQPKEVSSFEKSLKRTIKHVLETEVPDLINPWLAVMNDAKGFEMASPWPQQANETND